MITLAWIAAAAWCARTKFRVLSGYVPFPRWSLRIEFHLMDGPGTVSLFVNLGNDRENPVVPDVNRGFTDIGRWRTVAHRVNTKS